MNLYKFAENKIKNADDDVGDKNQTITDNFLVDKLICQLISDYSVYTTVLH